MQGEYVGIDLGGTNLRIGLVDEKNEVGDLLYLSVRKYRCWYDLLEELVSSIGMIQGKTTKAVGIAVAGGVRIPEGILSYSPHVRWMDGQPIREDLAKRINLPVWMDNDAHATTYAEWVFGAGKGLTSMICLTLGSGVGGGIILNGKLHRGEDGLGGEIGHMCVQPDGRSCTCGKKGCLEAYSSGTAISAIYRERNRSSEVAQDISPLQVHDRSIAGDELARDVFEGVGKHLGIVIANLTNVFSVHDFIITGGVSRAWELFFEPLKDFLEANLFNPHKGRVTVLRGRLGDKAGVMGAACMARDYLKSGVK